MSTGWVESAATGKDVGHIADGASVFVAEQADFAWLSPLTGMTVGTPAVNSAQEDAPTLGASTAKRIFAFQGPAQFNVAARCCS